MRIEITAHVRDGLYPLASALLNAGGFFMPHSQADRQNRARAPSADFRITDNHDYAAL